MSLAKFQKRIAVNGLYGAIKISLSKTGIKHRRKTIFSLKNAEDRFTKIYNTNHWNDLETRSGEGSTLENTRGIRSALPKLFKKYEIKTILDAPCGDFNWMRTVIQDTSISYIGGDIVRPLIEKNQAQYQSNRVTFIHLDLTKGPIPKADLMFCRDCLFHLSYIDIAAALKNFLIAQIPLLLTTTSAHPNATRLNNFDIKTGDMRLIDLFSEPFGLSKTNILDTIDDHMVSLDAERSMVLLHCSEVNEIYKNFTKAITNY